jgi:hypothetical protein
MSAAEELVQGGVGANFQHRILDGEDLVAWNGMPEAEVANPRDAREVIDGGPDHAGAWMLLGTVALVFASVGAMLGMRR